jgi:hypothetical protein
MPAGWRSGRVCDSDGESVHSKGGSTPSWSTNSRRRPRTLPGVSAHPEPFHLSLWSRNCGTRRKRVELSSSQRTSSPRRPAASTVTTTSSSIVHRPIRPGEPLQTWVEGGAARTKGSNSVVTLRYVTTDAQNEVVAEQLWRTVWLGVRCLDVGEAPPPHDFPDAARAALSDPGTSTWMARWPGATRSSRETGLGITLTRRPPDEAVPRGPSSTASVPWPSAPEGSARQSLAATRNVLVGSHCASHDLCCWARG